MKLVSCLQLNIDLYQSSQRPNSLLLLSLSPNKYIPLHGIINDAPQLIIHLLSTRENYSKILQVTSSGQDTSYWKTPNEMLVVPLWKSSYVSTEDGSDWSAATEGCCGAGGQRRGQYPSEKPGEWGRVWQGQGSSSSKGELRFILRVQQASGLTFEAPKIQTEVSNATRRELNQV